MTILIFENNIIFGQVIPTIDQLNNEAFELFNDEKYKESIAKSNQVLAIDPDNITALSKRANSQIALERFNEAMKDFERIFILTPEPSSGILYHYGVALYGIKEYEKAIEFLDLIDEDDHLYTNALIKKAMALLDLERQEEVIQTCDLVLDDNPNNSLALLYKAIALSNLEKNEEALDSIEKSLKNDPQNKRALNAKNSILKDIGLEFLAENKPEEAIPFFKRALVISQSDPNTISYLKIAENNIAVQQFSDVVNSYYVLWTVSLVSIALTIVLYFRPWKKNS